MYQIVDCQYLSSHMYSNSNSAMRINEKMRKEAEYYMEMKLKLFFLETSHMLKNNYSENLLVFI